MTAQDITSARDPGNVRSVLSMRGALVRLSMRDCSVVVGTVVRVERHTLTFVLLGLVEAVDVDVRDVAAASAASLNFKQTTSIAKKQRARFGRSEKTT